MSAGLDPGRVLDGLCDAVIVADRDNTVVYANPAVEALLGWSPCDVVGKPLVRLVPARLWEAHLAGFTRFFATGQPRHTQGPLRVPAVCRDGEEREVDVTLRLLAGDPAHVAATLRPRASGTDGTSPAVVMFLAEATSLLASSLDLDKTLANVVELVVPSMADWCMLDLLESDGTFRRVAVAHADPATRPLAERLKAWPVDPHGTHPGVDVVRRGRTRLFVDVPDEVPVAAARSPEHLAVMRKLGMTSAAMVPLSVGGTSLGLLTLVYSPRSGRRYHPADVALLEDLAGRAALAVEQARLHRDLSFQHALLTAQSEASIDGMLVVSPEGRLLSYNQRFLDLWPIDAEGADRGDDQQVLRAVLDRLVDPGAFLEGVHELSTTAGGPSSDELELRDGRVFERYGAPLEGRDGTYYGWAWYLRDITERKRDERHLRESSERFARLARTLQTSLLPPELPRPSGVETAARYRPAGTGLEVGGDFYDMFRIGRARWGVVIGDVRGKGAEAAAVTAAARYALRAAAAQDPDPGRVLVRLNAAMRQRDDDRFVTVTYAALRRSRRGTTLTLANGGHPLPLVVRHAGKVEAVGRPGTLLGVFDDVELPVARVELEPGDAVVFYTDGVTEARRGSEEFGEQRLHAVLTTVAGGDAGTIADRVEQAVTAYQEGSAHDDMALLVLRVAD